VCLTFSGQAVKTYGSYPMRKRILKKVIPAKHSHLLHLNYTDDGQGLIDLICENDFEGVVMKPKASVYANDRWVKVLKPGYSQKMEREKAFEKR